MPALATRITANSSAPLLVAAERLSLHEVSLPPTPAHRMLAALAGVLEEHVLDDPADLHFALAPDAAAAIKAGRPFSVMVCDKAWLTSQCAAARLAGHSVGRIVPDSAQLQSLGWDLAQFDFKPRSGWSQRMQLAAKAAWQDPAWRLARIALACLLVIQLLGMNLWAWNERAQLAAKRDSIRAILLQTFPDTTAVVDAPLQMQRGVALLRSKSAQLSDKDLEMQLAKIATDGKLGAQQIDFAAGQLRTSP